MKNAKGFPSSSGISSAEEVSHMLGTIRQSLANRQSVVEHVEQSLRDLIINGQIKPGERIVETRVARLAGISQPAVREALKTLQAEGLVTRLSNRGCRVVKLSKTEIGQIFTLRMELEVLAVKLATEACAHKGKKKVESLYVAVKRMKEAAKRGDARTYYQCDLEFHRTLWSLTGNPFVEKTLLQIMVPLFAFVVIEVSSHPQFDLKQDAGQHEKITEVIASGKAGEAMKVTRGILNHFWHKTLNVAESAV